MANVLSVFVSSSCNELRDLRAAIRDFLQSMEINPQLSEDPAFPRTSGDKPHVTCLRTLADCPLVIGILERKCGQPFADWSPFSEYNGLRPTHAELRHALKSKKKLLLYVHAATHAAYHQWRANPAAYSAAAGDGPEVATLELLHELKTHDPAPYFETYGDGSDVILSLRRNLLNEIYASLKEQEAQNRGNAEYFTEKILNAAPTVREEVQAKLNPALTAKLDELEGERRRLEDRLAGTLQESKETTDALRREKELLDFRITQLQREAANTQTALTMAAMRDARWLEFVRTTLVPKQPGRVPFHNSAEIEMRGYRAAGGSQTPVLQEVTWSKLPPTENRLHRGYKAGIVFRGVKFTPGITWTQRRCGETTAPPGNTDYFWRLPSIYFGNYLEVSASDDEIESPLSWRGYEFQLKNPEGQKSEWVTFSYEFDDVKLLEIMRQNAAEGRRRVTAGDNQGAIEPLRKAMVFADRILGLEASETIALKKEWNAALDNATLDKLRFGVGTRVRIIAGEYSGSAGVIDSLGLRQVKPYWIATDEGKIVAVADDEVEI